MSDTEPIHRIEITEDAEGTIRVESSEIPRLKRRELLEQATAIVQREDAEYLAGE